MPITLPYPPQLSDSTLSRLLEHAEHGRHRAPRFCEWICAWLYEEMTRRAFNEMKDHGQAADAPYMESGGTPELPHDLFGDELVDALRLVRAVSRSLTYPESDLIGLLERIEEHLLSQLVCDYRLLDAKRI